MPIKLDRIDRRILNALQEDGRLQNVELAKRVGLSPSPCLRRVRRLEDAGVIEGYVALLDAAQIGAGLTVFARVWLGAQDEGTVNRFIAAVQGMPEVMECHLMAGDCDFQLRIAVADLEAYRQFQVKHLSNIPGVHSIKTDIPMQKVKHTLKIEL
ncbi:Lrp/AsnC family transcriptional regulator [Halomonas binhaiensis]|uniref:Lrp/AsnC family transcriptional regulator n=1 Tax=Halomonas binhaiensis TaxID=2562282 RepID=UPI001F074F18|nr:Lrp/AsnC family transcriptional regulator [Halomonas binhaiensis]